MRLDPRACYDALSARDRRFDGLFFVGVATTGVYCRPVCTARTPRADRCTFFRSAAEAEKGGFRACFLCRPEVAPGGAPVDALSRHVAGAVRRIGEGYLNDRGLDELAAELGVTSRHLRRAMQDQLGVSPVELAQSARLAMAKRLLHDSRLELARIAFASGFRSVRRFNALFAERFGRSPSELRRQNGAGERGALVLRLDYRPPLDWEALLDFLGDRAIPGVELVEGGEYRRALHVAGEMGVVRVRPDRRRDALAAEVSPALAGALHVVVARLRALFDLDARPDAIARALGRDPALRPLVRRRPGLRLPGSADPFETAVRAVLGQQISVRGATTLSGRVAERFGEPLGELADAGLTHRFPTALELAEASTDDVAAVGLPRRRAECLRSLARAFARGDLPGPPADAGEFERRLLVLPGIGPWTAAYLSMRALGHPDAFPASDLGLRKALGLGPKQAHLRAEAWRPWRSYAVIHLWTSGKDST